MRGRNDSYYRFQLTQKGATHYFKEASMIVEGFGIPRSTIYSLIKKGGSAKGGKYEGITIAKIKIPVYKRVAIDYV